MPSFRTWQKETLTVNPTWAWFGLLTMKLLLTKYSQNHNTNTCVHKVVGFLAFFFLIKKRRILALNAFKEQFSILSSLKMQKISLEKRLYWEN